MWDEYDESLVACPLGVDSQEGVFAEPFLEKKREMNPLCVSSIL